MLVYIVDVRTKIEQTRLDFFLKNENLATRNKPTYGSAYNWWVDSGLILSILYIYC